MPYKVEIANTKSNTEFLQKLPKEILPEIAKRLNILGVKPYLGISVEGPKRKHIKRHQNKQEINSLEYLGNAQNIKEYQNTSKAVKKPGK